MNGTFRLPTGGKIRTSSQRRYIVVGHYRGAKPQIEYRTDDVRRATERWRSESRTSSFTAWTVVDTLHGTVIQHHAAKEG